MKDKSKNTAEIVLEDDQLLCLLTEVPKKSKGKENSLQSVIRMMNEEYGFDLEDMARDIKVEGYNENDKKVKQKVDLAIYEKGSSKDQENIIRVCIIQDEKTKVTDGKKGIKNTLENTMESCETEFGLWTNGIQFHYLQREDKGFNVDYADLSDFPGEGESLEDLDRNDRSAPRIAGGDSLVKVFKRCHDYIYGNEGMKKTAFWELLNLIFCKIHDEKQRFNTETTYRRKFWVGVKEQYTPDGPAKVAKRIKGIFKDLKNDELFSEVFDGNEQINLTDKGLAYVASELARYSFLDASVDVKGMAYETIVSNTLKQEAGQFFTPRNIIRCMVEMMDPSEGDRILDVACGSAGFLVVALDHVRKKIAKEIFPDLEDIWLEQKYNSIEVNDRVKKYADNMIFGFDFDPDLKKAARMNMVMAGDGHSNIFHVNSMSYPKGDKKYELNQISSAIKKSVLYKGDNDECSYGDDARGKFDLIFTNPPFGAKIPVNDPDILSMYDLGHNWDKNENGDWIKSSNIQGSQPPEILFVETCFKLMKPGARLAIVLPDGILSNPNTEYVRSWIIDKFIVLASIDLAVEAFLPQVGVQASLLFLKKKTQDQISIARDGNEDYEIFIAKADQLGKDRRGNPIFLKDDDGGEILFDTEVKYILNKKAGNQVVRNRIERIKKLNDDLPIIAKSFLEFKSSIK